MIDRRPPPAPWTAAKPAPDHCDRAWVLDDEMHVSVHQRHRDVQPSYAVVSAEWETAVDGWVRNGRTDQPPSLPPVTDEQMKRVRSDFRLHGCREQVDGGVRWLLWP